MSDSEYTLQDTQFPPEDVKIAVEGGIVYCDGVRVFESQLTPEELKMYLPERYEQKYKRLDIPCPIANCGHEFNGMEVVGKAGYKLHARNKHADWYVKNEAWLNGYRTIEELFKAIKAGDFIN